MAVSVDGTRSQFEMGIPQPLFVTASAQISTGRHYAVSRDGQRFLINSQMQQGTGEPITVLINWPATIQK